MKSTTCTYEQLISEPFRLWCDRMARNSKKPHRKAWELAFIAEALHEAGMFTKDVIRSGIGFGVGREPLPVLFVKQGCRIVATDLPADGKPAKAWMEQHCDKAESLAKYETLSAEERTRIRFRQINMNFLPAELHHQYDFCWSTSSMEHLGSLTAAEHFVEKSLRVLKQEGVAVHVTEHALFPANALPEVGGTVWFSKHRLAVLRERLEMAGHSVELGFDYGHYPEDYYVDFPPYEGPSHLKLLTDGFVSTSVGLIIKKK